jgi:RIO kinase 1
MKTPAALQPLIDDGVIDEVLLSLNSGKEATVYVVRSGTQSRCAKVYRDMAQRSLETRTQHREGQKIRGSRQARANGKSTSFGRSEQEAAWKNAEVEALYQLVAAGEYHAFLIRQVVSMLCIDLIHGELSEFNVLVAPDGPVIIDLPQAVNAVGNNAARAMLERDANNLPCTAGCFAPQLLATEFAREMWSLFKQGDLRPDSALSGLSAPDDTVVDPDTVLIVIDDAREEEIQRRLRLAG